MRISLYTETLRNLEELCYRSAGSARDSTCENERPVKTMEQCEFNEMVVRALMLINEGCP